MGGNDDLFWDHLLGHIEDQRLLPVVGPELTVVSTDTGDQTFTSLIGQRLAAKYNLNGSAEIRTMQEAVAMILQQYGRDEVDNLYGRINRIIKDFDPDPCQALRDLAAIDDLRLFVSTTPDRLLAKALNEVRFRGNGLTLEHTFSLKQATSEDVQNARAPAPTDTVVLNLFGRATATPEYAIHEEDRLEWLHALLPDAARLPVWLAHALRHQPMLFIGCEIPDWIGRFLLRLSSTERLSDERKQFFIVGNSNAQESSLSDFFTTYCRRPLVQQLEMEPAEFVSALRERCGKTVVSTPSSVVEIADGVADSRDPAAASIFISYMREDAEAARRLHAAITRLGGCAWLDERRLGAGDDWETEILTAIGETVRLFIPVISANTERVREGYVFREWNEARGRAPRISSGRFIAPVIIDDDYDGDLGRYPKGQKYFGNLHFGGAPGGEPDAGLTVMLAEEIAGINRPGAA